ncbi:MAG: M14 family metallocarboxypeptidase [bacterium]|nr:M14 family metallocarboxypeptidase [bacterium]
MATAGSILSDLKLFAKYHLVRRNFDYPARETELGIELLAYDTDSYAKLVGSYADHFELDELDVIPYQGRLHPIHRIRAAAGKHRRRSLLVLCGTHGNEYAGMLAVPLLLDHFRENPACLSEIDLSIVTPVNPVGAQEQSRYNAQGYDVNRDFTRFETSEACAVRRAVEEARPDFILSLHEGPHDGTFMFANRCVDPSLAAPVLDRLEQSGTRLAGVDYFGRKLETPGYARPTRPLRIGWWLWSRVLAMASAGVYADELGTAEITLESSWRDDADTRIRTHVECVLAVIDWMGKGSGATQ